MRTSTGLIPHQANIRIMQSTAKRLKMSMDKLIVTVDQHGNTSAASIPLALDAAVRSGKIKKGDTLMLEGVGGRLHLGRGPAGLLRPPGLRTTNKRQAMQPFAFVFPGQGSQSVGMLDAWGDHPAVAETLREASDALGEDVARLIKEGPKEALALTTNTQPVMLVAGLAAYRAWRAEGGAEPSMLAGHSLGEYTALVAAGALTLADAAPLVRFRAQAMQEAVPLAPAPWPPSWAWKPRRWSKAAPRPCACWAPQRRGGGSRELQRSRGRPSSPAARAAVDKACEVLKGLGRNGRCSCRFPRLSTPA
jgi:hypothetical protein